MRIAIHDYGGYAFIVGLSRALARRGHQVIHMFATRNPTPHGRLETQSDDPPSFEVKGIAIRAPLQKYRFFTRFLQEREYGKRLAEHTRSWRPDIVVSANAPLDSQRQLFTTCERNGIPFVFWVQDLIGDAMRRILTGRFGLAGRWLGDAYGRRERRMISRSSAIVVISQAFAERLIAMDVPGGRVHVIPNWAPLDELPLLPKKNPWSMAMGLDGTFNFLYAGSLGLKHDPSVLLDLARALQTDERAREVVVSEGLGASWLANELTRAGLEKTILLPYQPMDEFPQVLASADVLIGLLEADASEYSVPSKVLSYLCAGRPLVLAMPEDNPAAQVVQQAEAGVVVGAGDGEALVREALALQRDDSRRQAMGQAGRAFAESRFDLDAVADRFEAILRQSVSGG
jgi:colanic acid biosynthesis glycosyl transferase WcaI